MILLGEQGQGHASFGQPVPLDKDISEGHDSLFQDLRGNRRSPVTNGLEAGLIVFRQVRLVQKHNDGSGNEVEGRDPFFLYGLKQQSGIEPGKNDHLGPPYKMGVDHGTAGMGYRGGERHYIGGLNIRSVL